MNKNTIKVLFAPANTASMPDITLQALNRLDEIEAKGISFGTSKYWTFGPNWKIIKSASIRVNPLRRVYSEFVKYFFMTKGILWADILMWHWDIDWYAKLLVKILNKKIFVEWIGSDIRNPDYLFTINPYYKEAWKNNEWTYTAESAKRSRVIQSKFKSIHAQPLLCPEISLFLNKKYFQSCINFMQRIDLCNYKASYPSIANLKPVIVHTPSATGAKGTKFVHEAIANLKKMGLEFEYIEIHNKTREEALAAINSCDIFLDQFIVGSYGLATCEAMAMGKPVFCYLMNKVVEKLPPSCAIVNTTVETLMDTLIKYIKDPILRNEQGQASRKFVEEFHDADKIAMELLHLFQEKLKS